MDNQNIIREAKKRATFSVIVAAIFCALAVAGAGIYRISFYYTPEELKNIESVQLSLDNLAKKEGNLESKFIAAQNKYNALTDREKTKIDNIDILYETEAELVKKRQEKVEDAIAKIDKIGEVKFDLDTGKRISSAYTAYILVNEDMRDLVTNYADLEKAQAQYAPYKKRLEASQDAYERATQFVRYYQYKFALEQFHLVLPEDTNNYQKAQQQIPILEQQIKDGNDLF